MSFSVIKLSEIRESCFLFSLFLFVLNQVWPPGAFLLVLIVLSFSASLLESRLVKFSVAVVLASILITRAVPAFPSDDLDDYILIFTSLESLDVPEFFRFIRNEPIFYLPHLIFNFSYDNPRIVLFYISIPVAYFYLAAVCNIFKQVGLPVTYFSLAIISYPFEIASNIPRQMMAIFLFQSFVSAGAFRNIGVLILGGLTHKMTLVVALLSVLPYRRYFLFAMIPVSCVLAIYGLDVIEKNYELGIFQRLRSYFDREGSSGVFPLVIFMVVAVGVSLFKHLRPVLWIYLPILALAVAVADLGPLGIRLAYFGYIPCLAVCVAFYERFSKYFLRKEIILIFGSMLLFTLRFTPTPNSDHDPFSGINLLESLFLLPKIHLF